MKYSTYKLPNGVTVLLVPSTESESVTVDVFVRTGSRFETEAESGISHFLEHFLFKGTKSYPSAMAITSLVDGFGGEMNANTGKEHTQYFIRAASKNLPKIMQVLAEMVQAPLLDPVELEKEKGVIVEELNMYRDMPMWEIENNLENTMWPDQPLGRNIVGTKESVMAMTTDMFRAYMQRNYFADNIIVAVAGKFDQAEVKKLLKKYWDSDEVRTVGGKEKKAAAYVKAETKQSAGQLHVQKKATDQAHFIMGFRGLSHTDKQNPVAQVLAGVLGGGMSSRLFHEVREKRGLAYYVRTQNGSYHDTGTFTVSAGVKVDQIDLALKTVRTELVKIQNELVSAEELKKVQNYLTGRATLALEDVTARMDWYLEQMAFQKSVKQPQQYFKEIRAVTSKQVQAMARKLFQSANLTLAIIGPYDDEAQFTKHLKI